MRISDWSSDVCSSDLFFMLTFVGGCTGSTSGGVKALRLIVLAKVAGVHLRQLVQPRRIFVIRYDGQPLPQDMVPSVLSFVIAFASAVVLRSEEHTSELQSLMRISYAVFCLKKNKKEKT